MEDAHVHILGLAGDQSSAFFGVFDGHGGQYTYMCINPFIHRKDWTPSRAVKQIVLLHWKELNCPDFVEIVDDSFYYIFPLFVCFSALIMLYCIWSNRSTISLYCQYSSNVKKFGFKLNVFKLHRIDSQIPLSLKCIIWDTSLVVHFRNNN